MGDLRHAARTLSRHPSFTAVSVLILALGIGASTAIFSVADLVLWRSLPVRAPKELVVPRWSAQEFPQAFLDSLEGGWDGEENGFASDSFSYPLFERLRAGTRSFASVVASAANEEGLNVRVSGRSESATAQFVSGDFFQGLGVTPFAGRLLSVSDDASGAPPVAVASHSFWQRWLEPAGAAAEKTIVVNGWSVMVVGAAPRGFFGVDPSVEPDLWLPLHAGPTILRAGAEGAALFSDHRTWWLRVIGRLRPGVSPSEALAETRALFEQSLAPSEPKSLPESDRPILELASIERGVDQLRREHTAALGLLLATAGVLLAITCANVAGLLVARGASRRREIAVRASLGASRSRLVRSLAAESMLLSAAGSAAGVLLASWLSDTLLSLLWSPDTASRPALDLRLLAFALSAAAATALLSGLLPAWGASRADLSSAARASSADPRGAGRGRLGRGLVAAQVAATVVLLVVAGLFVRTLDNLRHAPVGFDTESLLLFGVRPGSNGYEGERLLRFYEELRRRLEAIPGVAGASFSRHPMVGGGISATSVREGGAPVERNRKSRRNLVGPQFFATLRIPIRAGRALDERDGTAAPRAAVVNTSLARSLFGDSDPVGRHIDFGEPDEVRRFEIVGVVGDTRFQDLRGEMPPTVYLSVSQAGDPPERITYQVRARGDAAALAPAVREALRSLDPDLPVVGLETQRQAVARVLRLERLLASLTASFGLTALILSCVGLYGSLALAVAGRTREIGVRMALGAERRRVVGMVVSSGLRLVAAGAFAGLAAALAGTRLLRSQLFGLAPNDPLTLAVAIALLFAAAATACAIPARRASRVDPMTALRME